jgi:hypothetical protein
MSAESFKPKPEDYKKAKRVMPKRQAALSGVREASSASLEKMGIKGHLYIETMGNVAHLEGVLNGDTVNLFFFKDSRTYSGYFAGRALESTEIEELFDKLYPLAIQKEKEDRMVSRVLSEVDSDKSAAQAAKERLKKLLSNKEGN